MQLAAMVNESYMAMVYLCGRTERSLSFDL